jgi:hypothetical protein
MNTLLPVSIAIEGIGVLWSSRLGIRVLVSASVEAIAVTRGCLSVICRRWRFAARVR